MQPTPSFKTLRLKIRRLQAADAEAFFGYRSSKEVTRFQVWAPTNLQEARSFIQRNAGVKISEVDQWVQLGLECRGTSTLIGDCGLHFLDADQVEIGISVAPEFHGMGLATEALTAVMNYLFADLGKHRVTASVDPDNHSSVALMGKLGMRKEAHHVRSFWFKGRWADDLVFAMLAEDFSADRNH